MVCFNIFASFDLLFTFPKGSDTRTTFMIRNIPNKYTQVMYWTCASETLSWLNHSIIANVERKHWCNTLRDLWLSLSPDWFSKQVQCRLCIYQFYWRQVSVILKDVDHVWFTLLYLRSVVSFAQERVGKRWYNPHMDVMSLCTYERIIGAGSIQKSVAHCLMPTFKEKRLLWKSFAIRQWWMNHLLTGQCYFIPLDPKRVNNRYIHLESHASLYIDPFSLAIPWTYNLCWNTLSTTTTYKWKPTPREKVMIAYPLSRFPCPKKYKWQHTRTHRRHLLNTYHVIFAKQHSTLLKNKVFLLYSRLGHPVTSAESNCNSKWQSIHLT